MNTTLRTVVLALAAALLLASLILFVLFRFVLPADFGKSPAAATPAYTIGVFEGQVAVFEGDSTAPMQIFDVYVHALPPEIREQLQQGVAAENADELSVLLEDFTS